MKSPRTRSWLFQKQSPDTAHVIKSLLSSPVLLGYVFGSHSDPQPLDFPDIGDLHTVFTNDKHTMLGFHFGFQGIQPIMPLLFQVAKDPTLGNPNVVVRRTATLKYPPANCFFKIEMNWCESGVLAVSTSLCPIHPTGSRPAGLTPFFDNGELRVFNRPTAERFLRTVQMLDDHSPSTNHPAHVDKCVQDFFDPPDDCYTLTVCEPDDPSYHTRLHPVSVIRQDCDQQSFNVESEMANHVKHTTTGRSNLTPLPRHCDRGEHVSVAEPETITLWAAYQNVVAQSRRLGIFHSMMERRTGGRFGKQMRLYGREARYTFLSTSGINLRGRIQRLCSQIGIDYSGPLTDRHLIQAPGTDDGTTTLPGSGGLVADGVDGELDITEPLSECSFEWKRRKIFDTSAPFPVHREIVPKSEVGYWKEPQVGVNSTDLDRSPSGDATGAEIRGHCVAGGGTSQGVNVPVYGKCLSQPCAPLDDPSPLSAYEAGVLDNSHQKTNIDSLVTAAEQLEQWAKSSSIDESTITREVNKNSSGTLKRRRSFDRVVAHSKDESSQLSGNQASFFVLQPHLAGAGASSANKKTRNILDTVSNGTGTDESHSGVGPPNPEKEATSRKPATTIWTCKICGVPIRGKKGNLNRHIANKHENIRAYACKVPSCGKRFQTRLNLVRHENAVHQGRPFLCPQCPRTFKTAQHLQSHEVSAHEAASAALACEVCGGCFGRRSTLNRHLSKVHKIDPKTLNSPVSRGRNQTQP
ncbi:hypothetical protein FGB62_59g030 [Gracilaria domingensis]|nr:hypothetical protein FGB62_59g030 [Gracilaria domingensis]